MLRMIIFCHLMIAPHTDSTFDNHPECDRNNTTCNNCQNKIVLTPKMCVNLKICWSIM